MGPEARRRLKLDGELTMAPPETFPEIVGLLLARGHAPTTVRKVMGGNLMRLAEQVWR